VLEDKEKGGNHGVRGRVVWVAVQRMGVTRFFVIPECVGGETCHFPSRKGDGKGEGLRREKKGGSTGAGMLLIRRVRLGMPQKCWAGGGDAGQTKAAFYT